MWGNIHCRVFVSEDQREDNTQHEGVAGKAEPDVVPVLDAVNREIVHYPAADKSTHIGADAIGHKHEQPLGACPDLYLRFPLDEERAGDIEEVESHPIDDHGEDQERETTAGIAYPKKPEPEHPGKDADQDDRLYPEFSQEERDG